MAEVSSHLVAVEIATIASRSLLATALRWPREYPWGRRVKGKARAVGAKWGLAQDDQLIVSDSLHNPHELEDKQPPFTVYFFRPRKDSSIVGVSLVCNILGVHSLGIDHFMIEHFADCTLHTLDLGVTQRYNATAIVQALVSNIYKLNHRGKKQLVMRGSQRMARDIKAFYQAGHLANPYKVAQDIFVEAARKNQKAMPQSQGWSDAGSVEVLRPAYA